MENTYKSHTYDFTTRRGESDVQVLANWKVNGVDYDLSALDEIRVDFRMNPRLCGAPDLSLTVENGGLKIIDNSLEMRFGENTLPLHPGKYYYDVLLIKDGERSNWVRGMMVLENIITR